MSVSVHEGMVAQPSGGGGESWEEWEGGGEKVTKADGSHQSLTTTVGFWEELCHSGWGGDPWAHSMNLNTNPT